MPDPIARVGVVIRTRNRPGFVERALRDVVAQSWEDWHVVIANDGGDRAPVDAIVERLAADLRGRVTVLDVSAPNGRCRAANEGIRAAGTEFVVLHDDDDRWHPEFLATTCAWLDAHPDDVGVMVPTELVYERASGDRYVETRREPFEPGLSQITFYDLLEVNRAVPISFLYRSDVHERVGYYDESLDAVEDWEFYLRVTLDHHIGFAAGQVLAYWSQRPADRGDAGNSMFALGDVHRRSEVIVRDRALRAYVREHGSGMPHYVAGLHARIARLEHTVTGLERWTLRGLVRRARHALRRLRSGG